jgi:phage anti-repressor protein
LFSNKINKIKAVENDEFIACSETGNIFYGSVRGNSREGIDIKHQKECFDLDIAEFIISAGSLNGEIGKF